jgi:soluble lytic murein transglycosylase-like protein
LARFARWLPLALVLVAGDVARADIFRRVGPDGTVYFTNVPPRGARGTKSGYQVYLRTPTPGGANARVPARDTSPERFHRFDPFIVEAARLYQIPEALVRAVILIESNYDPRVVSNKGAQGLMQLMPETAARMMITNSFDPRQNILGGTRYLRFLANLFNGDIVLTIAAYNAGEGAVARYGGIPPYESTQGYVHHVLLNYYRFRRGEMPG